MNQYECGSRHLHIFWGNFYIIFLESLFYKIIPKKKKDVTGEIVLITGAASGLGRLLAIKICQAWSHLVLWDINEEKATWKHVE